MPIKWSPENDQTLLLKIIETCEVKINAKAISDAWPAEKTDGQGKPPTPRAIQERLVKIRSTCKANGGGSFAVPSVQRPAPSTPRKPKIGTKDKATPSKQAIHASPSTTFTSSMDSGAATCIDSPESSQASEIATPVSVKASGTKRKRDAVVIKGEDGDDEGFAGELQGYSIETPSKKAKNSFMYEDDESQYAF